MEREIRKKKLLIEDITGGNKPGSHWINKEHSSRRNKHWTKFRRGKDREI